MWMCKRMFLQGYRCGSYHRLRLFIWDWEKSGRVWGSIFPSRGTFHFSISPDIPFLFLSVIFQNHSVPDYDHSFHGRGYCSDEWFCKERMGRTEHANFVCSMCWGARWESEDAVWVIEGRQFPGRQFWWGVTFHLEVDFPCSFRCWYLFKSGREQEFLRY